MPPVEPPPSDRRLLQSRIKEAEKFLPPAAYLELFRTLSREHPGTTLVDGNETQRHLARKWWLQRFEASAIGPNVTLFQGRASPKGRSLLIMFTAYFGGMTIPTAAFLQAIPARKWDVLMLRDPDQNQFRQGCAGFALSQPDLVQKVSDFARPYRRRVVLGASMGGLAAIRLALMMPDTRGISLGGVRAVDIRRLFTDPSPGHAFDPLCACLSPEKRDLWFLHGPNHVRDRRVARHFGQITKGRVYSVRDCASHNVIDQLWRSGRLDRYLSVLLNTDLSAPQIRARLDKAKTRAKPPF